MTVPPHDLVDTRIKVLEAFRTVALRFEKDVQKIGYYEIAHLLAAARASAEESLTQLDPPSAPSSDKTKG